MNMNMDLLDPMADAKAWLETHETAMAEAPSRHRPDRADRLPPVSLRRIEAAARMAPPSRWPEWADVAATCLKLAARAWGGDELAREQLRTLDRIAALRMALAYPGNRAGQRARRSGGRRKNEKRNVSRNMEMIEAAWALRSRNLNLSIRDIATRLAPKFGIGAEAVRKIIGPVLTEEKRRRVE